MKFNYSNIKDTILWVIVIVVIAFALYAGIDGENDGYLIEYKTGRNLWTEQEANAHNQILHYVSTYWLQYKILKQFKLISINSSNGKHVVFIVDKNIIISTNSIYYKWIQKAIKKR